MNTIQKGDYVTYTDFVGNESKGRVKLISPDGKMAYVVYQCNNNWTNYLEYTSARTSMANLVPGWGDQLTPPTDAFSPINLN